LNSTTEDEWRSSAFDPFSGAFSDTWPSHGRHMAVTYGRYMAVTWLLHVAVIWPSHGRHRGRHMAVTWPLHGRYMAVTWPSHGRLSHGRYMAVTWPSHGRHMAVTWPCIGEGDRVLGRVESIYTYVARMHAPWDLRGAALTWVISQHALHCLPHPHCLRSLAIPFGHLRDLIAFAGSHCLPVGYFILWDFGTRFVWDACGL
jgi:hypothetical protein